MASPWAGNPEQPRARGLAQRPAEGNNADRQLIPPQKAAVSMRPCRCKMRARAFCTASTSSGLHSTSITTYFLSRAPLEVRLPQTITRPFRRGIVSPENMKRVGSTGLFPVWQRRTSLDATVLYHTTIRLMRKPAVDVNTQCCGRTADHAPGRPRAYLCMYRARAGRRRELPI
jgi:hypothetical protein